MLPARRGPTTGRKLWFLTVALADEPTISRMFVARAPEKQARVLGFDTPRAVSIDLSALAENLARRLSQHLVPATLIGPSAVGLIARGMGSDRTLLADAVKRLLASSVDIAVYAIVADAVQQQDGAFYRHHGFAPPARSSDRRFLHSRSLHGITPAE